MGNLHTVAKPVIKSILSNGLDPQIRKTVITRDFVEQDINKNATPGQVALFDVLLEPTYIASSINNLEHQFQPDRKYS